MTASPPRPVFFDAPVAMSGTAVSAESGSPSLPSPGGAVSEDDVSKLGHLSMQRMANANETLLSMTKSGDVGVMGERLGDLILIAKAIDPGALSNMSLLRKLFGGMRAAKERFLSQYRTVSGQIDRLVAELNNHATTQKDRIETLEAMYIENEKEYVEVGAAILQGESWLPAMRAPGRPEEGTDSMAAQKLVDQRNQVQRLEKRIHDLRIAQALAMQTAPQIRLMQENARMLVAKFDDLTYVTIPAWKKQFSLQILMLEQESAAKVVTAVDDATNEAIRRNADLLKQNAGNIAKAGSRALVDIQTLQHSQQQLLEGIAEVRRITEEARSKRTAEVGELEQLQKNLVTALKR